ncbi:superoxide dismutase [Bacteroidales bacterium OttesenSCG-928-J19]|nr:superoxide dismutase [Bacteroidales bacterium OttesenSCG-928-J19]
MKLEMPILPYASTALAPVISEQTIGFHWGKHVQAYVNNLNNLVPGTPFENSSLEEIILKADGGVFNNGAQVWNHVFYFNGFSAQRGTAPSSSLMKAIDEAFGDFDAFRKEFDKQAATIFGSGWMWLVKDQSGKLSLMKKSNAENPMRDGFIPLLVADVWEHAYYLDYQNRRPDHLSALWNIVDWDIISRRYEA